MYIDESLICLKRSLNFDNKLCHYHKIGYHVYADDTQLYISVNVGEGQFTQSLNVRDLVVTFDQFLNLDDHITATCGSTYFHIRNIGKIRNLLSYNACSTIIHALISCRLDYCNSLLYNVPTHKKDRLQRLQNQCARILTKSPRR